MRGFITHNQDRLKQTIIIQIIIAIDGLNKVIPISLQISDQTWLVNYHALRKETPLTLNRNLKALVDDTLIKVKKNLSKC